MAEPKTARCEDCGLEYEVGPYDVPITGESYTCDDCGGYVDVVEPGPHVTESTG